MATNQTIATTITADHRPAVQSLRTFDAEVGKAFSRLDAMNKRAFSTGGGAGGIGGLGKSSSDAARGVLELSRGIEDFSTQFGTQGFAGGIRAASNNLSQMAMVMGGPLAGAIAGFAAAGATLAMPYIESLFDATAQTKKLKEETDAALKSISDLFERREAGNVRGAGFAFDLERIDDSRGAKSQIEQRRREARELEEREFFNRQQRDAVFGRGQASGFTKELTEELTKLDNERLNIQERQLQTQNEITRLKEREKQLLQEEAELQKQKDADEFAAIIRKFQEEDAQQAEQDAEREERENKRKQDQERNRAIRENERLENFLQSRVTGLGGKVDPLDDMNVPESLRGRITGLLGEIDEINKKPGGLAQVATADSQSLLRAQYQAKEAAEAKKQREQLIRRLEELIREVKNARPPDANDNDDVNLV